MGTQQRDKYIVRFPDGMREELKKLAEKNDRTLNAEIVFRLKVSLRDDAPPPTAS